MANDIFANDGTAAGTQTIGGATFKQPRCKVSGRNGETKTDLAGVSTQNIATIKDKYDTRWDDPRYYTGDAAT